MTEPPTTRTEIQRLLAIAERELGDAAVSGLSADGRFEHSYSAALATASAIIRSEGQRVHGQEHHRKTFEELRGIAEGRWRELADYLQHSRVRRNRLLYGAPGVASEAEAEELRLEAKRFLGGAREWLGHAHPGLL